MVSLTDDPDWYGGPTEYEINEWTIIERRAELDKKWDALKVDPGPRALLIFSDDELRRIMQKEWHDAG